MLDAWRGWLLHDVVRFGLLSQRESLKVREHAQLGPYVAGASLIEVVSRECVLGEGEGIGDSFVVVVLAPNTHHTHHAASRALLCGAAVAGARPNHPWPNALRKG